MMQSFDNTAIGGNEDSFQTTCWTEIIDSKTSDETRANLIINDLLSKYWKPVYCSLRRKGYDNEAAKDLTQGFFCEIVLGQELVRKADKSRGRFRTFLLTALDRYAINVHNKETARKRCPPGKIFKLNDIDTLSESIAKSDITPQEGFNLAWIADILDQVFAEVKQNCFDTGKGIHWKVFQARVLDPILHNTVPISMPHICAELAIESEAKASNMITTVKRRLRTILERFLQEYVELDSEVEEELSIFLRISIK